MKTECYLCGKDLSEWNLTSYTKVQCDMCTIRKVLWLEELERETGIDIINTFTYQLAKAQRETNNKRNLHKELKEARRSKKYSARFLGDLLGVSHVYILKMENGSKPLNKKALDFIDKCPTK